MDYQEATEFVDVIIRVHECHSPSPLNSVEKLKLVKALLWRGEKYEKMWKDLEHEMAGSVGWLPKFMRGLELKYLSKPKSRRGRLSLIINRLAIYDQMGKMQDIINMLRELRDEEEDV